MALFGGVTECDAKTCELASVAMQKCRHHGMIMMHVPVLLNPTNLIHHCTQSHLRFNNTISRQCTAQRSLSRLQQQHPRHKNTTHQSRPSA